jgi:glycosyltransferase involved in cell wall biosynthesis
MNANFQRVPYINRFTLFQPDASSFPEILINSEAGLLVPPNDPAALAQAWHELLRDSAKRETLSHHALTAAEQTYSVQAMRNRFLALAEPLVSPPSDLRPLHKQ